MNPRLDIGANFFSNIFLTQQLPNMHGDEMFIEKSTSNLFYL